MYILKQIDELTQEEYGFYFCDGKVLILDTYSFRKRESTRKRIYKTIKHYNRLSGRDSNLPEAEVPFTDAIKKEALDEFFKTISVKTWSEYKNR